MSDSASSDLQLGVSTLLGQRPTFALGDGAATAFPIAHNLAMYARPRLKVTETAGGRVLVRDEDYSVAWPDINHLTITALGAAPAAGAWTAEVARLRVAVPILARRVGNKANDIEAAALNHGLCIYVHMPRVKRVQAGTPFVFVKDAPVVVAIMEQPALNLTTADAWDLRDDVMLGLQFAALPMLKHPLYLPENPVYEINGLTEKKERAREIQVTFTGVYSHATPPEPINLPTADSTRFTADNTNLTADTTL